MACHLFPSRIRILPVFLFSGFYPVTFVANTGAPTSLYLNAKLKEFLAVQGRLLLDETGENNYVETPDGKKCAVLDTPLCHQPANIMGLALLKKLGFALLEDDALAGTFRSPLPYL